MNVQEAKGTIASLGWSGCLEGEVGLGQGKMRLGRAKVAGKMDSPRVREVADLFEPARGWQLRGHLACEGAATFDARSGWRLGALEVGCWPVEASVLGLPGRVAGLVNVRDGTVQATGVEVGLGKTDGTVTVDATYGREGIRGRIGTAIRNVDVDELVERKSKARASQSRGTGEQASSSKDTARQAAVQRYLASSDLSFVGATDRLGVTIDAGQPATAIHALVWSGRLDHGVLAVKVDGAFQGGPLAADVRGSVVDKAVPWIVHYRADRADATPLTQHLVVKGFPGMTVDGPVTLDERLRIDPTQSAAAIPSAGELIVEGGVVRGAAAPRWVTRIFPGLQLASFKFGRMHNWYERDAKGVTTNHIIFRGTPWCLYMNGWSRLDGTMRYEVGVDLLGAAESEYWAVADRGRLPLFIKTGRVVDGKLHDEVVSFLGPTQVAERLLKDNLLTITYHAIRQQVLRGRASADEGLRNDAGG